MSEITTKETIEKVKQQYELYIKAIEPYKHTIKKNGIVNDKENEILNNLVRDYMNSNNVIFVEKDNKIYFALQSVNLEILITQGTLHISTTGYHKKYYLDVSLEIQNIYNSYETVYIESIDKFPRLLDDVYTKCITGQFTDIQMTEFIFWMQNNLLTLNKEKHFLNEHNLPSDYEYTLTDTVYTDSVGDYLKYLDFGIAWQMLKNRIELEQYH